MKKTEIYLTNIIHTYIHIKNTCKNTNHIIDKYRAGSKNGGGALDTSMKGDNKKHSQNKMVT